MKETEKEVLFTEEQRRILPGLLGVIILAILPILCTVCGLDYNSYHEPTELTPGMIFGGVIIVIALILALTLIFMCYWKNFRNK